MIAETTPHLLIHYADDCGGGEMTICLSCLRDTLIDNEKRHIYEIVQVDRTRSCEDCGAAPSPPAYPDG